MFPKVPVYQCVRVCGGVCGGKATFDVPSATFICIFESVFWLTREAGVCVCVYESREPRAERGARPHTPKSHVWGIDKFNLIKVSGGTKRRLLGFSAPRCINYDNWPCYLQDARGTLLICPHHHQGNRQPSPLVYYLCRPHRLEINLCKLLCISEFKITAPGDWSGEEIVL